MPSGWTALGVVTGSVVAGSVGWALLAFLKRPPADRGNLTDQLAMIAGLAGLLVAIVSAAATVAFGVLEIRRAGTRAPSGPGARRRHPHPASSDAELAEELRLLGVRLTGLRGRYERRPDGTRLTRTELAARAGVNPSTMRKYFGGKSLPSAATLEKLLVALRVGERERKRLGDWRAHLESERTRLGQHGKPSEPAVPDGAATSTAVAHGPGSTWWRLLLGGTAVGAVITAAVIVGTVPSRNLSAPSATELSQAIERLRHAPLCAEDIAVDPVLTKDSEPRAAEPGHTARPAPTAASSCIS